MLNIDQLAYANRLRFQHPMEKFLFSIITMTVCLVANSYVIYFAVILLMSLITLFRAGIPWRFYFKLILLPLSFLLIGLFTIVVSIGWQGAEAHEINSSAWLYRIAFNNFWVGIRLADTLLTANIFLKSLATVTCLYFLSLTTPMVEIIAVLKKLRVPKIFIELMSLVYRFVFVLLETAQKVYVSQNSRCGYGSLKTSFNSAGQLLSSVFVKSFHKSQNLFTSLSARGFTGDLNVLEPEFCYSLKNISLIIVVETLLIMTNLLIGG